MRLPLLTLGLLAGLATAASADEGQRPAADALEPGWIDEAIDAAIAQADLQPSPPTDDAAFLRRVTLDLIGTVPTVADVEAFLGDSKPGKRRAAIESLLRDPAFAARQAELWTDTLLEDFTAAQPQTAFLRERFRAWLEEGFSADRGWDAVAADLLAGEGQSDQDPRVIYTLDRGRAGAEDLAGSAARQLLGMRIDCARCHDHPFAQTTQAEFHTLAAWFARARIRPVPGKQGVFVLSEAPVGEHRAALLDQPKRAFEPGFLTTKAPMTPGARPAGTTANSRRVTFARWATSPGNPWFARAAVNRVWARLFGRGLVEPVNDLAQADAAPAGPLLARLGRAFADGGFSTRALYAALTQTRAYQRAVDVDPAHAARARAAFAAATVRPLDLDARVRTTLRVVGRDAADGFLERALRRKLVGELLPLSPTLPDGQRTAAGDVTTRQGLVLLNGVTAGGLATRVATLTQAAHEPRPQRLRHLWLRVLGRPPRADELQAARRHLRQHPDAGYDDLAWALLASSEFLNNH